MKRNIALDITKGIAILLVIIGHCGSIPYMPIRHLIFTFHMPLFFLISGYLYKKRGVKETLKKDLIHLGIPYAATCLVILLYYLLYYFVTKSHNSEPLQRYAFASIWGSGTIHKCKFFADFPIIGAIWFLPALLVCKNVYNALPNRNRLLISSFIFVVATIVGRYIIFIPFSVLSGLSAIIFYAIGDYLKTVDRIPWPFWIIGLACWLASFRYSRINLVQPQLDLYFIDVFGATFASILVYLLSKQIARVSILTKGFQWIGKSTLYILCFHLIDLDCGISLRLNIFNVSMITVVLRILLPIMGTMCFSYCLSLIHKKASAE